VAARGARTTRWETPTDRLLVMTSAPHSSLLLSCRQRYPFVLFAPSAAMLLATSMMLYLISLFLLVDR
jgi:hypothetical protein